MPQGTAIGMGGFSGSLHRELRGGPNPRSIILTMTSYLENSGFCSVCWLPAREDRGTRMTYRLPGFARGRISRSSFAPQVSQSMLRCYVPSVPACQLFRATWAAELSEPYAAVLESYASALAAAPLTPRSRHVSRSAP
jgi:hypothetical protein